MYCSCIFNRIAIDQLSRDSPPRTSAAALSAAVDSRKLIEDTPNIRRNQARSNKPRQTPAALREGARGRGFSQRSRLPRISSLSFCSSGEGVWGRGASLREAASSPRVPHVFLLCTSAAALSAAVDSINKQKTAPTFRRNQLRRSTQLKRQPLFGREREGGASLREAASLAYPHFRSALRERGSGGETLLSEKRPLPQSSPRPSFAGIFLRVSNETSYRFG